MRFHQDLGGPPVCQRERPGKFERAEEAVVYLLAAREGARREREPHYAAMASCARYARRA